VEVVANEVDMSGAVIPRVKRFRYLASTIQENGEIDEDIKPMKKERMAK